VAPWPAAPEAAGTASLTSMLNAPSAGAADVGDVAERRPDRWRRAFLVGGGLPDPPAGGGVAPGGENTACGVPRVWAGAPADAAVAAGDAGAAGRGATAGSASDDRSISEPAAATEAPATPPPGAATKPGDGGGLEQGAAGVIV